VRRPARPTRGAQAPTARYGGERLRCGAGHRRGGQRPATVRFRAKGSGPGCPATCGESPLHPGRYGAALLRSFTLSVLVPRILREIGPAGRLDDREENPHSLAAEHRGRAARW
jgi:hypothetical protein